MASKQDDILVVEDDEALSRIFCRFIAIAGFSARAALDGESALRMARECPPKLVLLDLMLPDISGFDVCVALKHDQGTSHIPVIFVTAMADEDNRRRGLECGAAAYLTKPIHPDQLLNTVKQYMSCLVPCV